MNDQSPLPYSRHAIDEEDIEAVVRVLRSDRITQGSAVGEFEDALCTAFGPVTAVAVNSGTAALHLGMAALGIGPGDLVIVPPITFVASANAALFCGADVAFVDVEPDTGLLSAEALAGFLDAYHGPLRPRAVVAVHYAGLPCDLTRLQAASRRFDMELIEDACHAPGATWIDSRGVNHVVGDASTSAFAALSFHPVKHFTTAEGGAVLTNRPALAEQVRLLREHGITRDPARMDANAGPWWYEQRALGFNYRMPDVLAALGTSQLRKHGRWLKRRREIASWYREALAAQPGIAVQAVPRGREHAYHLFPILSESRDHMFESLLGQGIRPQVHYIPIHIQPLYEARYGRQCLPDAEAWYLREVSIPMYPTMSDEDVERVCEAVHVASVGHAAGWKKRRQPSLARL